MGTTGGLIVTAMLALWMARGGYSAVVQFKTAVTSLWVNGLS